MEGDCDIKAFGGIRTIHCRFSTADLRGVLAHGGPGAGQASRVFGVTIDPATLALVAGVASVMLCLCHGRRGTVPMPADAHFKDWRSARLPSPPAPTPREFAPAWLGVLRQLRVDSGTGYPLNGVWGCRTAARRSWLPWAMLLIVVP